jgi:hypothetical protein
MNEQTLFLAALDKDPAERATFLDEACGGDATLRGNVEKLLRLHADTHGFLEVPAIEQLAGPNPGVENPAADLSFLAPSSEPGSLGRLDYYEILEIVGRGGTGVVLRARDTKLARVVAIKVLAAPLAASGTARQRFAREARAAAAGLRPRLAPRLFDQDVAHRAGGGEEEMLPAFPGHLAVAGDPQIGLVDQGRRLEGLARRLVGELLARQTAQFVVDQRQEISRGLPVPGLCRLEHRSRPGFARG